MALGPWELLILAFFFLHFALAIAVFVDAVRLPEWAFRRAQSSKALWVVLGVVSFFFCYIGSIVVAIVWFGSTRARVVAAAAQAPPPLGPDGGPW